MAGSHSCTLQEWFALPFKDFSCLRVP
ncbi:hypothetical protein QTP70_016858 [Hemibagrus guttatus]|uniref:Uncharacterized protein n=1 Tax=Hemibagrus guttatus TaxID=175788 RepID=A0AAE0QWE8_9TELE|nr:hypothetical protein QTP70_016858 [Hemibagrus guttatus]KAK3565014.1 hypothetical protein QTP86_032526 [Hemibagrus guttatus]